MATFVERSGLHRTVQVRSIPLVLCPVLSLGSRMNADEIMDMVRALELPEEIRTKSHWCFTNVEALCLTLARYGTGGNQSVLTRNYMRPQPAVSEIFTWVVQFIDETWRHLLDFDEEQLLSKENLERYAQAVHEAGAPLEGMVPLVSLMPSALNLLPCI